MNDKKNQTKLLLHETVNHSNFSFWTTFLMHYLNSSKATIILMTFLVYNIEYLSFLDKGKIPKIKRFNKNKKKSYIRLYISIFFLVNFYCIYLNSLSTMKIITI